MLFPSMYVGDWSVSRVDLGVYPPSRFVYCRCVMYGVCYYIYATHTTSITHSLMQPHHFELGWIPEMLWILKFWFVNCRLFFTKLIEIHLPKKKWVINAVGKDESQYNVCLISICTKHSSNTLLRLVRFFMKQTLWK